MTSGEGDAMEDVMSEEAMMRQDMRLCGIGIERVSPLNSYIHPVQAAAAKIGASPADIPGLWNAPGYPELTTGQLLQAAALK